MSRTLIGGAWCLCAMALAAWAGAAAGEDWPQYQGLNRDGVSPETGLARTWPENGPKTVWTVSMGAGYAGASIRDGEVYVLDRQGEDKEAKDVLRCLELETGKELWFFSYAAPGGASHDGSRTSPAIDAERVYAVGLMGDFYCLDRKTHKPAWIRNLLTDFKVGKPGWGVTQAPCLYKNLVIVAPQAADAFVVAYNQADGKLVWKSESLGSVGYSTPTLVKLAGADQVLMVGAGKGKVAGLSPETGKILWAYEGWECKIPIPFPIALPGDRVFVTGGYNAGSAMLQVHADGGKYDVKELFKTAACASQIHEPIFYKDFLYVNSNTNEREDGMMCFSPDGQVKWKTTDKEGLPKFDKGHLLMVDNVILFLDGKKGDLHMIDPSPDGYKELAVCKVFDGKEIWGPMAFSRGKLVLRNQTEMKCLDLKNPQ